MSVIPEKRVIQVYELPKSNHCPVNAASEGDCPSVDPANVRSQDVLPAGNSLASLAETGELLTNSALKEPEVAAEQTSMEENVIEPYLNTETMAMVDSEKSPVFQEEIEHGESIGESQWLNSKPTGDIIDQDINDKPEQLTDTNADDLQLTMRRSERLRRPPKRFHYDELGKPLISFAKSLLESFNKVLDTLGDNSSPMTPSTKHEGTEGKSRSLILC